MLTATRKLACGYNAIGRSLSQMIRIALAPRRMSMIRSGLLVLLGIFTVGVATASAQNWRVVWQQPNATPAEAQAYIYRLSVDSGPSAVVPVTCNTVSGNVTECQTARPALGSGPHVLTLTAENGFGSASASVSGQPPANPVQIRITVEITVP